MKSRIWDGCIVYDVEVIRGPDEVSGGWKNPEAMGFATAVAYQYETDRYHFFEGPAGHVALLSLLDGQLAVSFNGVAFDSRVILGNDRTVTGYGQTATEQSAFYNFDILLEYVKTRFNSNDVIEAEKQLGDDKIHDGSFNLDGMAEGTLWMNKSGDGAHAPVLYRQKKFSELFEYNLHDVRLTKMLFDFVMSHGFVIDRVGRKVSILGLKEALITINL